jgi:hypothetical protein
MTRGVSEDRRGAFEALTDASTSARLVMGSWFADRAGAIAPIVELDGTNATSLVARTGRSAHIGHYDPLPADAEERTAHFADLAATAIANAEARQMLASRAATDELTGLPNYRSFHERLRTVPSCAGRGEPALEFQLRGPSALDGERWKPVGTYPLFYTRQVCDAAMYSVNYEQSTVKHAYPQDHIGLPPIARHVIYETLNSQVIRLVLGCMERLAAFPIYRSQLAECLVVRVHVAHEAGEQRRRLSQFFRR